MNSYADGIQRASEALGYTSARFRRLPPRVAECVHLSALRHFVPHGEPRWWWEHFPVSTAVAFPGGDGWRHLTDIAPDADERVWFLVDGSIWEATVRDIQAVIGECDGFEYYLIQQEHHWLICENHHGVVIGVGKAVEERLRAREA